MNLKTARNLLLVAVTLLLALLAGCSASSGQQSITPKGTTSGLVRETVAGQVTIIAEHAERDGQLVFNVSLDTHSVDLTRYDLGRLAVLQDDRANEYPAAAWVPSSDGGNHHAGGQLRFASPSTFIDNQTKYIRLVIKEVGGVVSTLQWDLEPQ